MTKLWTTLLILSLVIVSLSYLTLGRIGLLSGIILSSGLIFLVRFFSEGQLLFSLKANPIWGSDPWGANRIARELSEKYQYLTPRLFLAPDQAPYSFTLSSPGLGGSIVLSRGLLDQMSTQELRVIITYHLIMIQEQHPVFTRLVTSAGHSLLLLGRNLDRVFSGREPRFEVLMASGNSLIIRLLGRQSRHHIRDGRVAAAIGDSKLVAQTLWKLHNLTETLSNHRPLCGEHLLIVNPLTSLQNRPYLKSHPSVESRIRQLVGQYPL